VGDTYYAKKDTALTVDAPGVRGNDYDPDGNALSAIKVSDPSHGTISNWNSNGSFTYTPTTGYSGADSFTYKVNDGSLDSSTVTVSITIVVPSGGGSGTLVLDMPLNEGSGNVAHDNSGHGHNGTILGTVQWDSNGLVFGPSKGRITIPGASELEWSQRVQDRGSGQANRNRLRHSR